MDLYICVSWWLTILRTSGRILYVVGCLSCNARGGQGCFFAFFQGMIQTRPTCQFCNDIYCLLYLKDTMSSSCSGFSRLVQSSDIIACGCPYRCWMLNLLQVQGLMRGTLSGRVLAEEQYASRKVSLLNFELWFLLLLFDHLSELIIAFISFHWWSHSVPSWLFLLLELISARGIKLCLSWGILAHWDDIGFIDYYAVDAAAPRYKTSMCSGWNESVILSSVKVKDHALDTEAGVMSLQGKICGVEFLYLWNSFPQVIVSTSVIYVWDSKIWSVLHVFASQAWLDILLGLE